MTKKMYKNDEKNEISSILSNITNIIKTVPHDKNQLNNFNELIKKLDGIESKDLLHICYNESGIDFISLICKHNKKKMLMCFLQKHILHFLTIDNKDFETKSREDAFFYAMYLNKFEIIEMLYDHWVGYLHWIGHNMKCNNFDINNLNLIHTSLQHAFQRYKNTILNRVYSHRRLNQNMMYSTQSLLAYGEFQVKLYKKLNALKNYLDNLTFVNEAAEIIRLRETNAIRQTILIILKYYKKYADRPKSTDSNTFFDIPSADLNSIENTSKIIPKITIYVFFEVYFRKLDYNICLLIIDNLHSLKLRLKMPKDEYQKLESKVYQFIYHGSNNWSLYIPRRRKINIKTFPGKYNNIECTFSFRYNNNRFQKGFHIIYLERTDFKNTLSTFHTILKKRNVEKYIRKDKIKLPNEEINYLTILPELRDIYSLKKISKQIAQLFLIDKCKTQYVSLLIERTLQVIGEFLKSTNETLHLQSTTGALIEAEVSVEVIYDLKALRDLLCHIKKGELLKRIEIETNHNDIINNIFTELQFFKTKVDEVIIIYKRIVERALILNSLTLINNRKESLPKSIGNDFFDAIKRVRLYPKDKPYGELFWIRTGYAEEFTAEIQILVKHSLQLESKLILVTKQINENLEKKIDVYKERINRSLQKVISLKRNWQMIVQCIKNLFPNIVLLNYPNETDTNTINTYSKKVDLADDSLKILAESNTLFTYAEINWKFIRSLLEFIFLKSEGIKCKRKTLDEISNELKSLDYQNNDSETIVGDYLDMIDGNMIVKKNINQRTQFCEFIGVKELKSNLNASNFLSEEEKKYLTGSLLEKYNDVDNIRNMKIKDMIDKIETNKAFPKREYTNFISTMNLNEKERKILRNLVMGYKRDTLTAWCFSQRIFILKNTLKNQSVLQLVTRYKLDTTFRILLEFLVFDILEILACTKNEEIVKKSSKFLTEINLRNLLIHGNPLLEVAGNVLDSDDFPTELVSKALELLKEERSINALCALQDSDFEFSKIHDNFLSPQHKVLVKELKTSARWKDYLNFIPELEETKKKKFVTEDVNLHAAVLEKDSDLVRKRIIEGGNVNFVDAYDRALVHHAAIKRSVEVLKVLLESKADVNIKTKHNMTALHFSAMNGFSEVVDLLLEHDADCFAINARGETPVVCAEQRNHEDVRLKLEQRMMKKLISSS